MDRREHDDRPSPTEPPRRPGDLPPIGVFADSRTWPVPPEIERAAGMADAETVEDGAGRIVERIDTAAVRRTREEAEEHRTRLLRRVLSDPGAYVPRIFTPGPDWDPESTDAEPLYLWQARAVEHVFPELVVDPLEAGANSELQSDGKVPRRRAEAPHLTVVTYSRRVRDFFRMSFWVRCWHCDLKLGPFTSREGAEEEAKAVEADEAGMIPSCA